MTPKNIKPCPRAGNRIKGLARYFIYSSCGIMLLVTEFTGLSLVNHNPAMDFNFIIGTAVANETGSATKNVMANSLLSQLEDQPGIVLFYSRDCTPCHIEMNMLPELKPAMGKNHLAVVSMTPPDEPFMKKLKGLDIQLIDISDQDASALLHEFNDQHLALPFSFAVDQNGSVCAQRTGLLGLDTIRNWRKQCLQ